MRKKISPKTKAILINSPHNPTGAVLSEEDIEQLRSIVKDTNIFIVSDEVYEHLIFDNIPHQSILRYPDLLERSFVCFSFGKTYNCTGWKLGYCISSPESDGRIQKSSPVQLFQLPHAVTGGVSRISERQKRISYHSGSIMQEKRDYFIPTDEEYQI